MHVTSMCVYTWQEHAVSFCVVCVYYSLKLVILLESYFSMLSSLCYYLHAIISLKRSPLAVLVRALDEVLLFSREIL